MLIAIVVVQSLVVLVLAILVAGLLRSHAELLKSLGLREGAAGPTNEAGGAAEGVATGLPEMRSATTPAHDVVGTTLAGDAVKVAVSDPDKSTLLAFLSSGCEVCQNFWRVFGRGGDLDLPDAVRLVIVTRDRSHEIVNRLEGLAPEAIRLVMSSQAWKDYEIPGHPYFIYVNGKTGRVHGEGTAQQWNQVMSLFNDALADEDAALSFNDFIDNESSGPDRLARMRREDSELQAAGVGPDHPSLYSADFGGDFESNGESASVEKGSRTDGG